MKYYAVKAGKTPGIFDNWSDCSESVKGFTNADFKAFPSREEAEAYLNNTDLWGDKIKIDIDNGYIVAFCDGSYDDNLKRYSWGVLIIDDSLKEYDICGYNNNPKYLSGKNVTGEILGVINALDWANSNGYSKIKIYHDYEGLEKWATGSWKVESEVAKMYVAILNKHISTINIAWEKIIGHSNNKFNDKADELAQQALINRKVLVVKGKNLFALPYFKESELQTVLDLLIEEHPKTEYEKTDTDSKTTYRLKLNNDKLTITLFKSGYKKILVQGANSLLQQIVISFICELVEIDEVEPILSKAYSVSINPKEISDYFNAACNCFPTDYPENIKKLIKQSIINLKCAIESEEYSQYAFPALRALEGHMKYIFNKNNILVKKSFDMFEQNIKNTYELKANCSIHDTSIKAKLEKYYNYYHDNRHSICHFGEFIGDTDTTRMIETKDDADEIIQKCIEYICE